jgi:hypothetical protein
MMCVADDFAVVCLDAITVSVGRERVAVSLKETGHELVEITPEQMANFAGNMLLLRTTDGGKIVALSRTAFAALASDQRAAIERHRELVPIDIPTIETAGGGSVRCMIAEIFLKSRS